jgi:polysaccharide pyruvyl transferase CsaB
MRILISGYYGFDNAGDEAILAGTVGALRSRLPECDLTVLSADPAATRAAHAVHAANRWHWPTIWRELGDADLLLQGGGGLIQDATSGKSALYYLGVLAAARMRRTPYMIYAQGVGPLTGRVTRRLTGWLFSRAAALTVRDEGSAGLLGDLGISPERIAVTADAAALLEPAPAEDVAHLLPDRARGPRIGVALREAPGAGALVEGARRAARWLAREQSGQLVFLALHPRADSALAEGAAADTGGRCLNAGVHLSPAQLAGVVGNLDFVIAMRLHAAIFAATQAVPFAALAYDPKVAAFAESVGAECASATADADEVAALVRGAWAQRDAGAQQLEVSRSLRLAAERNIDPIEELLHSLPT